jgi:F0F1-type ATP synthase assembly protein I
MTPHERNSNDPAGRTIVRRGEGQAMLGGSDPRDMARYVTLGQVGGEMVAPIVIGVVVDRYLEWTAPWGAVVGAVLGLAGGLFHLVYLVNKKDSDSSKR